MAPKARTYTSQLSEVSKNGIEGQAKVPLKRKASHLVNEETGSTEKENEPPCKAFRRPVTKKVALKRKANPPTQPDQEIETTAVAGFADGSLNDKLSTLFDSVRRIHKCVDHSMRLAVANEKKLQDMNDQLIDTGNTIVECRDADQQNEILEKLGELESQLAGMETAVMDELAALSVLVVKKVDQRFYDLEAIIAERFDSMQGSIESNQAGGHRVVQHIYNR